MHKKWKYSDVICVGCAKNDETENELLLCDGFGERNEELTNSWLFGRFYYKLTHYKFKMLHKLLRYLSAHCLRHYIDGVYVNCPEDYLWPSMSP